PTRVGRLIHEEHRTILQHFLSLGYGLCNYYKLATNYTTFKARIAYILYYSCVLTLASKYRLRTMKKVINKFGFDLTTYKLVDGKKVVDTKFNPNSFDNIKRVRDHKNFLDLNLMNGYDPIQFIESMIYRLPRSKAVLNAPCFVCNSKVDVEMHHIKHLKSGNKLNGADYLTNRMIKMNRKQVPLCKSCHL
ncbi:group II intron reverse transcriptase/maturase, partial [Acinetobacter baumannii]